MNGNYTPKCITGSFKSTSVKVSLNKMILNSSVVHLGLWWAARYLKNITKTPTYVEALLNNPVTHLSMYCNFQPCLYVIPLVRGISKSTLCPKYHLSKSNPRLAFILNSHLGFHSCRDNKPSSFLFLLLYSWLLL